MRLRCEEFQLLHYIFVLMLKKTPAKYYILFVIWIISQSMPLNIVTVGEIYHILQKFLSRQLFLWVFLCSQEPVIYSLSLNYFSIRYYISLAYILCCNAEVIEGPKKKSNSAINVDPDLLALLQSGAQGEERYSAHNFFLTLAACNTVIPMIKKSLSLNLDDKVTDAGAIDYQGESPDEQALVAAASAYGYALLERTTGHVVVNVSGKRTRYTTNLF